MKQRLAFFCLCLGAALLLIACTDDLSGNDGTREQPTVTPSQGTATPEERDEPLGTDDNGHTDAADNSYEDEQDSHRDENKQRPTADVDFEGFTHFPLDFAGAFADPDNMALRVHEGEGPIEMWRLPVTMFFNPPHKIVGARKWYFKHPHIPEAFDDYTGTVVADWQVYLVADGLLTVDRMNVDVDRHGNEVHTTLQDVAVEDLFAEEINGEVVYRGMSIGFQITESISVVYDRLRLRKAIVDEVLAGGGAARFPAGTPIAYGGSSMWVFDDRIDASPYPPGVNPFDYFTSEKQQELFDLYEPLYEILRGEGVHPFTDITKSDLSWNVPGTLEGAWTRTDARGSVFHAEETSWELINLIGLEHVNAETYWRVLNHPWNIEHNFSGLFIENFNDDGYQQPLYDLNGLGQPLHESRFYLIDGDLSDGVAMIISNWVMAEDGQWAWDPLEADGSGRDNHPSNGALRYLRFEVRQADGIQQEVLRIQGFLTEEEARAGFTEAALEYQRDAQVGPR